MGGSPHPGDFVLFGRNLSLRGPRQSLATWQQQTATLLLGEVTTGLYQAEAPHWPDEVSANQVRYGHRFGFIPLGQGVGISLDPHLGLGDADAIRFLRLSGTGNAAYLSPASNIERVAAALDVRLNPTGQPNLAITSLALEADGPVDDDVSAFAGAGRTSDPALRSAVEQHAIQLAKEHMREEHDWADIKELGKPFDLVCRVGEREKHVEVKGTTGSGGTVEYTTNEVDHFRTCPHGADLIVVREICVDRSTTPYTTSGGVLRHVTDYRAPGDDLQPIKYKARVTW